MSNLTPTIYPVTVEPRHFKAIGRVFQKALERPEPKQEVLAMTSASMIIIAEILMAWIGDAEGVEKTMEAAVATAIETVIEEMPNGMR